MLTAATSDNDSCHLSATSTHSSLDSRVHSRLRILAPYVVLRPREVSNLGRCKPLQFWDCARYGTERARKILGTNYGVASARNVTFAWKAISGLCEGIGMRNGGRDRAYG